MQNLPGGQPIRKKIANEHFYGRLGVREIDSNPNETACIRPDIHSIFFHFFEKESGLRKKKAGVDFKVLEQKIQFFPESCQLRFFVVKL